MWTLFQQQGGRGKRRKQKAQNAICRISLRVVPYFCGLCALVSWLLNNNGGRPLCLLFLSADELRLAASVAAAGDSLSWAFSWPLLLLVAAAANARPLLPTQTTICRDRLSMRASFHMPSFCPLLALPPPPPARLPQSMLRLSCSLLSRGLVSIIHTHAHDTNPLHPPQASWPLSARSSAANRFPSLDVVRPPSVACQSTYLCKCTKQSNPSERAKLTRMTE